MRPPTSAGFEAQGRARDAGAASASRAEADRRIQIILESTTDGVLFFDREWRITYFNVQAERFFGCARETVLDRVAWECFPRSAGTIVQTSYERAVAEQRPVTFEVRSFTTPDRWVEAHAYPSEEGLSVFFRDITERKRAEDAMRAATEQLAERTRELETILDVLPIGVWRADRRCERIIGNRAAYEMFGLPTGCNASVSSPEPLPDEVAKIRLLVEGREVPPEELPMQRAALRGETVRHLLHQLELPSGEVRVIDANVAPLRDARGEVCGAIAAYADVTALKRAEEEAAAARAQLQLVTDLMAAGVTRCSRDLRYLWVNRRYGEWLDRPVDTIVGRPIREVLGEEAFRVLHPHYERVLSGERVEYGEETEIAGIGRRHLHASYVPTRDGGGDVDGWVAVVHDITERKRAEQSLRESEERFRVAQDSSPIAFTILGAVRDGGRIVDFEWKYANRAAARLLKHEARELVGRRLLGLLPGNKSASGLFDAYVRVVETGEPHDLEVPYESDGIHGWFQNICTRHDDGVAIWSMDVSERKRAEEELHAADRRKDDFLAMLAHELRNPLAPIRNAAHILNALGGQAPKLSQTSALILRQVEHITNIVDDLLDVSRVTRGLAVLQKGPLDIRSVVADAIEQVRPFIESRRHRLAVHLPPSAARVMGDRVRLVQVFGNILNNAARYTPEGGSITATVEVQSELVLVRVRDNGLGITPELLPHIFELFTQAQRSPDRAQGGLGLGLALVKSLLELHGGSVDAWSGGPGEGSEFTVRLPRLGEEFADGRAELPSEPAALSAPGLRVLVVDDNTDAAETLAMLLQFDGHEVAVAHDGRTALERARLERPEVLLLDLGLPEMDGYELARRLRAQPETASAALIALTGYGQDEDRARSTAAGFDHHLVKPLDPDRLIELLRGLKAGLEPAARPL